MKIRSYIFSISNTIKEGRDAYLYHGTSLGHALLILHDNKIYGTREQNEAYGTRTSRNYRMARLFGTFWERVYPVVFVLDQAKLVHNHKILPYRDHDPSGYPRPDESEEIIIGDLTNLSTYLISINIDPNHLNDAMNKNEWKDTFIEDNKDQNNDIYINRRQVNRGLKVLAAHPLLNKWLPLVQRGPKDESGSW